MAHYLHWVKRDLPNPPSPTRWSLWPVLVNKYHAVCLRPQAFSQKISSPMHDSPLGTSGCALSGMGCHIAAGQRSWHVKRSWLKCWVTWCASMFPTGSLFFWGWYGCFFCGWLAGAPDRKCLVQERTFLTSELLMLEATCSKRSTGQLLCVLRCRWFMRVAVKNIMHRRCLQLETSN